MGNAQAPQLAAVMPQDVRLYQDSKHQEGSIDDGLLNFHGQSPGVRIDERNL
jgi:hypothetical protein